jgi:hypothetical protein
MRPSSSFVMPGFLKYVYIHNPFYLISAVLVLYGLRQAFSADGSLYGGWLMMSLLGGYTLLLAVTAFVVIRLGRVWQDARMILLVMVLILQALPINFEEIALHNPLAGAQLELVGFLFAVAVSEGVLRSLKMRLAAMYRVPYFLILALLYFYPIPLSHWSLAGNSTLMTWGVFLFPALAGMVFLTLLIAVHRGGRREPHNGTPWPWPWYPWALFVVLAVGTGLRSFELSLSFEAGDGIDAAWQPYFLTPLLLAAAVLVMEMGVVHANRWAVRIAMIAPLATLLTAFPGSGSNPIQNRFLVTLIDSIGGPAQLTLVCLSTFYLLAWLRKIRLAEAGLVACLLLSAIVDHQTVSLATLVVPRMAPLWAVAVLQLSLGMVHRSSWRWLAGCLLAIGATTYTLRETPLTDHFGYYPIHLAVIVLLATGLVFRDGFARWLRTAAPFAIPLFAVFAASAYDRLFPDVPGWVHLQYIAMVTACGFAFWLEVPLFRHLLGSLLGAGCYCAASARHLYALLQNSAVEKGLYWLIWGMAFLALAVLISLSKGGLIRKLWTALHRINDTRRGGTPGAR